MLYELDRTHWRWTTRSYYRDFHVLDSDAREFVEWNGPIWFDNHVIENLIISRTRSNEIRSSFDMCLFMDKNLAEFLQDTPSITVEFSEEFSGYYMVWLRGPESDILLTRLTI